MHSSQQTAGSKGLFLSRLALSQMEYTLSPTLPFFHFFVKQCIEFQGIHFSIYYSLWEISLGDPVMHTIILTSNFCINTCYCSYMVSVMHLPEQAGGWGTSTHTHKEQKFGQTHCEQDLNGLKEESTPVPPPGLRKTLGESVSSYHCLPVPPCLALCFCERCHLCLWAVDTHLQCERTLLVLWTVGLVKLVLICILYLMVFNSRSDFGFVKG